MFLVSTFAIMKLFIVCFLLIQSSFGFCQMLDNSEGETFSNTPFFNTNFIQKNKVKQLPDIIPQKLHFHQYRNQVIYMCMNLTKMVNS